MSWLGIDEASTVDRKLDQSIRVWGEDVPAIVGSQDLGTLSWNRSRGCSGKLSRLASKNMSWLLPV